MLARSIGLALCGALSAWPVLARAEQTIPGAAASSNSEQQNSALLAATPQGQAAPDLGAGDSGLEQARALFWSAHERYDAGEYAEAAKLFEASYAAFPQTEVLFNIALARARSGRCDDAEQAFEEYSRAVSSNEATRAANENFRDILGQCWQASGKEALSTGVLAEPAPAVPAPNTLPAPKPTAALAPLMPEVAEAPPASYWTTQRVVGWSLLGAAAAATGVAIYFDSQRRDALEKNDELQQKAPDDEGDLMKPLNQDYQLAKIGLGVATAAALGSALVGTGLLVYSGDDAVSATAQVAVDPSGARIGLSGHF